MQTGRYLCHETTVKFDFLKPEAEKGEDEEASERDSDAEFSRAGSLNKIIQV